MPLAVRIWGRWTGKGPEFVAGSYKLKFGFVLNVIGLLYLAFACITFNFPSVHPVNASNMNYTCAAVGASALIAGVTWFTTGKKGFSGPEVGSTFQEVIHAQHAPSSANDSIDLNVKDRTGDTVIDNKAHSE